MAAIYQDEWAVAGYNYMVTINGQQLSFSEVKGGGMETQIIEYRTGDQFETPWNAKRQGLMKFEDWTFTRGTMIGHDENITTFNLLFDREYTTELGERFDMLVELLDDQGETVASWNVHNCFPTKINITGLKGDGNALAIEEMVVCGEVTRLELA